MLTTNLDDLGDAFDTPALGLQIVRLLYNVHRKVHGVQKFDDISSATMRSYRKLDGIYHGFILPSLLRYRSNSQLRQHIESENPPDLILKQMAIEEQDELLHEIHAMKPDLYELLFELLGINNRAAIVEIGKAKDFRLSTFSNTSVLQMYLKFARTRGWHVQILEESWENEKLRSAVLLVEGRDAYRGLVFENGLHRFIYAGREDINVAVKSTNVTHTNLVQVRVYARPQPSDLVFDLRDVVFETMRSSGAGGQHVNRTESAVRAKHIPTGLEVHIENQRSQHDNKRIALDILKAKIFEQQRAETEARRVAARNSSGTEIASSGAKYVRTYDARYNINEIQTILGGNLQDVVWRKLLNHAAERLPDFSRELEHELDRGP